MFTRSYEVEYHSMELQVFKEIAQWFVQEAGFYYHINNYPYDLLDWESVKTLHLTVRYNKECSDDLVENMKQSNINMWFIIQENSKENKSVKDIPHFHCIKVLDDNYTDV